MLSRRVGVALVAGVGIVIAALVVTGFALAQRTNEVGSIDGHPVTRAELAFHGQRHEPLDALWRDKATLILANEQGLTVPVDHEEILTELAEENERRADAVANGEVVYGLTEFSIDEYYSHLLTEVRTALKQRLSARAGDPLWVTEADVRRAFDADRDAWSAGATTYRYSKLVVRQPADAADLQRRAAAANRLADLAREPRATLTTGTYDASQTGMVAQDQDLAGLLDQLDEGQISAPVVGTDEITYYELDGETVDENAAFTKYAKRIRQSLVEKKLDQYVQRRIAASDIQIDTDAKDVRE
ncbi:peptidyl-prolyl cis-trans isomerase [Tenggerimyces flavus]|uniref:Peptidyl-prolyl cis-trans isomerase n=1 Tax=Tenggerimyces flavus TaxID=1708749 RepID=A0ABV7Y6N1_9ACTN|nr:peptidyl-prolyl cis-trans isomerase [Tenggerimyces flavus]MBM7791097.1 hypothetical protein [Tenggerimyces flavus]